MKTNKIFKNENGSFRVEEVELETKETQPILFIVNGYVVRLEDWREMATKVRSYDKGEEGQWKDWGEHFYKDYLHPIFKAACKGNEALETLLNSDEKVKDVFEWKIMDNEFHIGIPLRFLED